MTLPSARDRSTIRRFIAGLSVVVLLGRGVQCAALEWQPIGPSAGWVATLAVDPRRPATVYAGMARHGLYRSTDGGEHWALLDFPNDWVSSIDFHPTEPATLFVATSGAKGSLMRSTDDGLTWARVGSAMPPQGLVFDPTDPETMYIGQSGCVMRTEGTGSVRTWSPWCGGGLPALDPIRALYVSPRSHTLFALTAAHGLMESGDHGEAWQPSAPEPRSNGRAPLVIGLTAVSRSFPPVVYAAVTRGESPLLALPLVEPRMVESPVMKSSDGGKSWRAAGLGLRDGPQALAIAPSDTDTAYAVISRSDLATTTNGGARWHAADAGLPQSLAPALAVDPGDARTAYVGTLGGGVFKTNDGGTSWRRTSSGLDAAMVLAIIAAPWPRPALFALTLGGGPFVSDDGGHSWRSLMAGLPRSSDDVVALAADPTRPGTVYIGTHEGVFQSEDSGAAWHPIAPHTLGSGVVALVVDSTPPRTVYAGLDNGALVRQRGDGPWSVLHAAPDPGPGCGTSWFVTPLVVDPRHPGTIYWGVARTVDDGASWTRSSGFGSAMADDPTADRAIYAADPLGDDGRVLRSVDGGVNWLTPGAGLPEGRVEALVVDSHDPATVYVAKKRGIYVSYDRGRAWRALDAEVSNLSVLALALDPADPRILYAGTEGHGILKARVPPPPESR